jgi:hypothetical protein
LRTCTYVDALFASRSWLAALALASCTSSESINRAATEGSERALMSATADTCSLDVGEKPVQLTWFGLNVLQPDGAARLVMENRSEAPLSAAVSDRINADGRSVQRELGRFELPAGAVRRVSLPLEVGASDPSTLRFAAQLLAQATLTNAAGKRVAVVIAPELYFHPNSSAGEIVAYDERAHQRSHGAGDFRRSLVLPDPELIASIGRGHKASVADLVGDPADKASEGPVAP